MFTRIGRFVIAFALYLSIGGHLLGLQSIAWGTMVVSYSQHCSFTRAVAQTFDGNHPCDLCKHISKARDTEKKQDKHSSVGKTDLFCTTARGVLLLPFLPFEYSTLITASKRGSDEPPSPPPRETRV
jgi:hypothetical protein